MASFVDTKPEVVKAHYASLKDRLAQFRARLGRPLTLAEKVLFSHLADPGQAPLERGKTFLMLRPDRVAMQDATAQMAILQFIQSGRKQVAAPTTIHCDHLIRAYKGAAADMATANQENLEVYDFLKSAAQKYGMGFWEPGSGIIHQVVLENYAFPGGLMIGTDSHTPNAGGLGMLAIGVGGGDAVDVMAGMPWELKQPKLIGVRLTGSLKGWTSPKDVILKLLGMLTVKGGTDKIVEYFGPGTKSISCTGKATITNMGAELGATCSVFPYDERMGAYLRATGREALATLADQYAEHLRADAEVESDPKKFYDEVFEIDLATLEPHVVGPHSPDVARPLSKLAAEAKTKGFPETISSALIGSCTNSSYEDITRAAYIVKGALAKGMRAKVPFLISPGSDTVYETIKRDGMLDTFVAFGGTVLANACGPCIGQWKRDDVKTGETNAIVTSFNRNFKARNDDNPETLSFISSPEVVVAMATSGRLAFDPASDTIDVPGLGPVKLEEPSGPELPPKGFLTSLKGYQEPAADGSKLSVNVRAGSERLQLLAPFAAWDGKDFVGHVLLAKTKGKTTTDHISPAGKWLRFRGHLDRISDNMLLGATNAFTGEAGKCLNLLTLERGKTFAEVARAYKAAGQRWMIVGDENYGEGSSREHAAMSPRYLGVSAVIVKSFARIHETNLKKQGVLALTFASPTDYDKIGEADRLSLRGLAALKPKQALTLEVKHPDGKVDEIKLNHSYNDEQIAWFKAGSALNILKD